MESLVAQHIRTCTPCAANTDTTKITPLKMTTMPDEPWTDVSIDLYGPFGAKQHLLVLVDEHSRYPVVKKVSTTAAHAVIPAMEEVFALLGVPARVKSDNGPPFDSAQFRQFADSLGFRHHRITPLWPRANATCERFMPNLGAVMRKSNLSHTPWEVEFQRFLGAYRSTPHSTTRATPCELMFRTPPDTSRLSNFGRATAGEESGRDRS